MYEFTIVNNKTNEERVVFGYGYSDAMKKLNKEEWTLLYKEYID